MPMHNKAKGDHSSRVGGRRKAAKTATKSSMAKTKRGGKVVLPGGAKSYHDR